MFLKKRVKPISMILLFCVLAWYARSYLKENDEEILLRIWDRTFHRFGPDCIYWIAMRLTAWITVYLHLLRLESGFSIYLFLRQKSYGKVFLGTYTGCMWRAACYYGAGTLIMAIFIGLTGSNAELGEMLQQSGLLLILAEESLDALSFCLAAYAVYCVFRKAEAGFLVVLAGRLLLNFATGGVRPTLAIQITVNLIMLCIVFFLAFRDFAEKYIEI